MGDLTALSTGDLPSDVYYFARLTPTDHSGVVWAVATISLTYALICSGVRFTLRRGMYGFDDAALLISTLACVVQHAFIFAALKYGLGNSEYDPGHPHKETLSDSTYTRIVLFFVVHSLAKVSLTLFTRRLFHGQEWCNQFTCDVLLFMSCTFCVISILLLSINCNSQWYFATKDVCPNLMHRWVAIKALDVLTEVALVLVPIILILKILINQKHKLVIISTYAARLPVIAFTIVHYYYLQESIHSSSDNRSIALVQPVVWLQITLLWSMVTASLPSFRPLISPFDTVMEDSTDRPDPALRGSALLMGSDKRMSAEALPTWATISETQTQLSRLDTTTSTANWRADFKGHTETTIQGPSRSLFRFSKREVDIELGTIRHEKDFEVKYEKAAKSHRWSFAFRAHSQQEAMDGMEIVEKEAASATGDATDQTPAPRRRSAFAFPDETDQITEVQDSPNDAPLT